ncbi:MAG: hypothetical protein D6758_07770 [Gammaproteobacteria bacterium]|nr:MAG: hypothetical protein D6758_07770 [Gammaproteobacteria bacterium]
MTTPAISERDFSRKMTEQLQQELDDLRQRVARLADSQRPADRLMAETYQRLIERRESLVKECNGPWLIGS